ncbi:MAG: DUF4388 domain-containing protein [Myxococcales bacterium]|nr:DUF4388 domain-containing protein [Myxococcales bacterium]
MNTNKNQTPIPAHLVRHRPRILLLDPDERRIQRKKNALQRYFPTAQIVDVRYLHQATAIRQKLSFHLLLIEQPIREHDFPTLYQLQQNEQEDPTPILLSTHWQEITQRPSFAMGSWFFLRPQASMEDLCSSARPLLAEPPPFPEMTGPLHPTAIPNLTHMCSELQRTCLLRLEGFLFYGGLWFESGRLVRVEYKTASPVFLGGTMHSLHTFDLQGEKALQMILSCHQGRFVLRELEETLPTGLHNIARRWDPLHGLSPTEEEYIQQFALSASYDAIPALDTYPLIGWE